MAAKKNKKKKIIDGVVKDVEKKTPRNTVEESPLKEDEIKVSPEDTKVVIIEADNIEELDTLPKEGIDNTIIEEPPVEIEEKPELTESTKETERVKIEIGAPEEEALVMSSVVEEKAIEDNLDELISDIEKEEPKKKEKNKKAEEKNVEKEGKKDEEEESKKKEEPKKSKEQKNPEEPKGPKDNKAKKTAKAEKTSEKKKEVHPEKPSKRKKEKRLPARALPFRIISRLLAFAAVGTVASAVVRIALTGIVPNKYLIPAIAGLALILLFILFKAFRRKTHIPVLIIIDLICIALSVVSVFGFVKVQETMNFLFNNFNESKEYTVYNVIVSDKSNYNSLDDVKGKTFHSISAFVDTEKLQIAAKDQANADITYEDGISSLLKNTASDTTYIAVLNSGTWDATLGLNDGKNDYVGKYKVIGELNVEEEKTNEVVESNLSTESFTVFISGIDTRSGVMLDRSLSDVNIIMTVNPKTKNILMTTIPRDYYVQLHGVVGLRDKLTHAGALGGLALSMDTIEDLLEFEFSRYVRVNFNFVIDLVNTLGGLTLYSDVNYNISAYTNRRCTFVPGNNQVDGACALAFARERYAYADGDRHRGRNQEQVIEKIFEKLTNSTTFISRYSDILNSLSGSFDTNISTSDITSLVNMQLNDMAKWTVETYNLDGTTGMTYTYSYPNQLLSVMYPDETTVGIAKLKIKQVLQGAEEAAPTETEETIIEE